MGMCCCALAGTKACETCVQNGSYNPLSNVNTFPVIKQFQLQLEPYTWDSSVVLEDTIEGLRKDIQNNQKEIASLDIRTAQNQTDLHVTEEKISKMLDYSVEINNRMLKDLSGFIQISVEDRKRLEERVNSELIDVWKQFKSVQKNAKVLFWLIIISTILFVFSPILR